MLLTVLDNFIIEIVVISQVKLCQLLPGKKKLEIGITVGLSTRATTHNTTLPLVNNIVAFNKQNIFMYMYHNYFATY